jgi:cell division protein FtsL
MSVPARQLPAPRPREPSFRPSRAAPPARHPAARPTPSTPPQRRARRGSSPAFWLLAAVLVSALVFGIVGVNALVVNTTYRMTEVVDRVRALEERHDELEVEVARLSSPSRIATWADVVGMVVPEAGSSVILRARGDRSPTPERTAP